MYDFQMAAVGFAGWRDGGVGLGTAYGDILDCDQKASDFRRGYGWAMTVNYLGFVFMI